MFLFSCGKYQEPRLLDMQDHDGDQIPNHLEDGHAKYIADFEELKVVRGVIKFAGSPQEEIVFSNQHDLNDQSVKLLTGETAGKDAFFTEWSDLKLNSPVTKNLSNGVLNTLHFYFEPTDTPPEELVLIHEKGVRSFGKWSEYMKLQLSQEEFLSVLEGTSKFRLRKKFHQSPYSPQTSDTTIQDKTYRVHINDGEKSKVLYVAKSVSENKLHSILSIPHVTKVTEDNLFFNSQEQGPSQWFQRDLSNGDKVLIWLDIATLKQQFLNQFKTQKLSLARVNGIPQNSLHFENKKGAKIYLRIRAEQTIRSFKEYSDRKKHRTGGGYHGHNEEWVCDSYYREISAETNSPVTLNNLFENLIPYEHLISEMQILEQQDEKGFYWEVIFSSVSENITFSLTPQPESTYTTTGQYKIDCHGSTVRGRAASYRTNQEGKLSFEIESFVEKL
jgi:hypothetical protein